MLSRSSLADDLGNFSEILIVQANQPSAYKIERERQREREREREGNEIKEERYIERESEHPSKR